MNTASTPLRVPLATVLIACLVLFALLGAGAAALLVLGTTASAEHAAVRGAR